jgi:hypothetical protein
VKQASVPKWLLLFRSDQMDEFIVHVIAKIIGEHPVGRTFL